MTPSEKSIEAGIEQREQEEKFDIMYMVVMDLQKTGKKNRNFC